MARIALPTRESLTDEVLQRRWDQMAARGPVLNVFRMFMLNSGLDLNVRRLWQASGLAPRQREIVILRCACVRKSTYEWHQHVRIASGESLSPAEINAVRDWQPATVFSADERALLAYVDALKDGERPGDAVFQAVAANRSPAEIMGVSMLITTYFQLAAMMAIMDLETEEPFVGWDMQAT